MTLVDSNVLIDVIARDPIWAAWSIDRLASRMQTGPLYINAIVYAEVAVKLASEAAVNEALAIIGVELIHIPTAALFLAGKAFGTYRQAGGTRSSTLPDFFIGAHAQVTGLPLLTRDVARYRTYFPKVELIAP